MVEKKALLLVDLQNDFCTGGNLAVPGGEEVIPVANRLQPYFNLVIATQDWHPAEHLSFATNHPGQQIGNVVTLGNIPQILWPDHCIQHSKGAEFHPSLDQKRIDRIFHKGIDHKIDSYSAFYDNAHQRHTGLEHFLKDKQVSTLYIMGLATDYCVKYSVIDAINLGFNVIVIEDGCRGVELVVGDTQKAIEEMRALGAQFIHSEALLKEINLKAVANGK